MTTLSHFNSFFPLDRLCYFFFFSHCFSCCFHIHAVIFPLHRISMVVSLHICVF